MTTAPVPDDDSYPPNWRPREAVERDNALEAPAVEAWLGIALQHRVRKARRPHPQAHTDADQHDAHPLSPMPDGSSTRSSACGVAPPTSLSNILASRAEAGLGVTPSPTSQSVGGGRAGRPRHPREGGQAARADRRRQVGHRGTPASCASASSRAVAVAATGDPDGLGAPLPGGPSCPVSATGRPATRYPPGWSGRPSRWSSTTAPCWSSNRPRR